MPAWGAVLIAVTGTLVGIAIEAGSSHRELGAAFASCFAVGCVVAALAVRQSGVFTAVVQPPLLLFVAVPSAYYLFHSGTFMGLKDALISCGYPLIERFPLMLFTTAAVLLVGLVRWYLAKSHPAAAAGDAAAQQPKAPPRTRTRARSGLFARVSAALAGTGADEATGRPAQPRHANRPTRAKRPTTRAGDERIQREERPAPSRSRHSRRRLSFSMASAASPKAVVNT